jgi:hypothetical protein
MVLFIKINSFYQLFTVLRPAQECITIVIYRFYVLHMNVSLIWRCHHCRWRGAKFRSILGVQGNWAGKDLYRITCCNIGPPFFWFHPKDHPTPFSGLLRHTRGCGGYILTRILTGPHSVISYNTQGEYTETIPTQILTGLEIFTYFSIWRRHHYRRRAVKVKPMLGALGVWAGRDLYHAKPAVTWSLGFSDRIKMTAPFR